MIYSNIEVSAEVEETERGEQHYIVVGEYGSGRKVIKIACSEGTVIKKGMKLIEFIHSFKCFFYF